MLYYIISILKFNDKFLKTLSSDENAKISKFLYELLPYICTKQHGEMIENINFAWLGVRGRGGNTDGI